MKSLCHMSKSLRQLLVGILAVMPLLMVPPTASAADHQVDFSQAELDQMLAPIALYPDTILSQVLIAATYPLEVVQADRWVRSNKDLKPEDALKFAENKDWDPSVKALVAFPDILKRMSEDIDWTQKVGDAFLDDEKEVMDTVQKLRKRAYASGNLDKAEHIRVEEEDSNIIIEPAEERVVYVPVYDTRVVYGNWWWPEYPPVYWSYPSSYTYVSGFYWGPSIFIGTNYYYSSCHWRDRRVVVVDRHYYHSAPQFYTGRSIVRYEGAREWHHDPVHRHGVAYFNERQRNDYGSRHNSYEQDRSYREQYRNNDHRDNRWENRRDNDVRTIDRHDDRNLDRHDDNNNPRIVRGFKRDAFNTPNTATNVTNNSQPVDRAEQLRERMNRTNDESGRHWDGNNNHLRTVSEPAAGASPNINGNNPPLTMPENASQEARQRGVRQFDRAQQQNQPLTTDTNRAQNNDRPQRGFNMPRTENSAPQPTFERHVEQRPMEQRPVQVAPPHESRSEARSGERVTRGFKRDKDSE